MNMRKIVVASCVALLAAACGSRAEPQTPSALKTSPAPRVTTAEGEMSATERTPERGTEPTPTPLQKVGKVISEPYDKIPYDPDTVYEATGLVLEEDGKDPMLCVGAIASIYPPSCGSMRISGWDWEAVADEETHGGTTWGHYRVIGRYDGETFTLTEAPLRPRSGQAAPGDVIEAGCTEPEGGWDSPRPDDTTDRHLNRAMRLARRAPDSAGEWIDYVEEPTGEEVEGGTNIIVTAAFTGSLERHERALRRHWGGPLCVIRFEHTYSELRRIQRDLNDTAERRFGFEMTFSSVNVVTNTVELGVVVTDTEADEQVAARYGNGVVIVMPELKPVS